MKELHIAIKNRIVELPVLAESVEAFLREADVPSSPIYIIHLAIEELVVNVIRYAHDDGVVHDIGVSIVVKENRVTLTVEDNGTPFDPTQVDPPKLTELVELRQPGGLGIHIVRKLSTTLQYRRHDGKNRTTVNVTY